jgi:hypothetical protein
VPKYNLSISGISIAMAIALSIWEVSFFFFGWEGLFSVFVPNRLGFHLAWITAIYLSFQLISVPFIITAAFDRGRCHFWQIASFEYTRTLGNHASSHSGHGGGSIWRIHFQYRIEPPDVRYHMSKKRLTQYQFGIARVPALAARLIFYI